MSLFTVFKIPSILLLCLIFSAITCTVPTVDYANHNSQSSTIDYNTDIIYTCQPGYSHTGGNLTRSCKANGTMTGSTPVCTRKFAGNALALFQIIFKIMFILTCYHYLQANQLCKARWKL